MTVVPIPGNSFQKASDRDHFSSSAGFLSHPQLVGHSRNTTPNFSRVPISISALGKLLARARLDTEGLGAFWHWPDFSFLDIFGLLSLSLNLSARR
jgi:hypothetical protein